jgi:TonB family protein
MDQLGTGVVQNARQGASKGRESTWIRTKASEEYLRKLTPVCLIFLLAGACFGQASGPLCPKHIETPVYPPIARAAHLTGETLLLLTIDADGGVKEVKAASSNTSAVLSESALGNIRHWTFVKPPIAPYTETIIYDYEFDGSLPGDNGSNPITKVVFDLPNRVTIATNLRFIDTDKSKKQH